MIFRISELQFSEKAFKDLMEVKNFDYLLGMSMWMLTDERKNELLKQRDAKLYELEVLKKKSNKDLWREDLDVFLEKLDAVEEKERKDEMCVKPEKKTVVVSRFFATFTSFTVSLSVIA